MKLCCGKLDYLSIMLAILEKISRYLPFSKRCHITGIKSALSTARSVRGSEAELLSAIQDYPVLCDLAKAFIAQKDWQSAQDMIRVCFKMRDEYASHGGIRSAVLIQRLSKEFIKHGREDIAQHILKKVRNFEAGAPLSLLSQTLDRQTIDEIIGSEAAQEKDLEVS